MSIYLISYSLSGLVGTKESPQLNADMVFGYQYDEEYISHQPKMIYSVSDDEDMTLLGWNANGQMTSMLQFYEDHFRHHLWDEAGQLAGVIGNEYCGYYGYDGDGERVFKLTGTTSGSQYNASSMYLDLYFDDVVMYVSPYMVVTPKGYTKHYYNGSQRIAARLGDYWNNDMGIYYGYSLLDTARVAMEKELNIDEPIEEVFDDELLQSIDGEELSSEPFVLGIYNMMYYMPTDMLSDVLYGQKRLADDMWGVEDGVYFYHPDHLGSSSWITDDQGHTAQYIHYMPYGEIWRDKQESAYNERFRFTGKERDTETGYDYFGARYYLSLLGIWISPDPLMDKYPSISSYAYCNWNPLKYIDREGRNPIYSLDGDFLGTDDTGLQGDAKVMDKGLFQQGMNPDVADKLNVEMSTLTDEAKNKINAHYQNLPNRPDWDGYLTLDEANDWYRNGGGKSLYTDLGKIDLSGVLSLGEKYVGDKKTINLLLNSGSLNDGLVYGNLTLKRYPNNAVRAYADSYDFQMHSGFKPSVLLRNCETLIGRAVAGQGKSYSINIYGSQTIKPLFIWTK